MGYGMWSLSENYSSDKNTSFSRPPQRSRRGGKAGIQFLQEVLGTYYYYGSSRSRVGDTDNKFVKRATAGLCEAVDMILEDLIRQGHIKLNDNVLLVT